ncbi:MAG: Ig-like domain-containing protein, partial [Pyrinomonadaceae bacterium]
MHNPRPRFAPAIRLFHVSRSRTPRAAVALLLAYLTFLAPLAPMSAQTVRGARTVEPAGEATPPARGTLSTAPGADEPVPNAVPTPIITATKRDSFPDPNADGLADPGETITYTVQITNSGTAPATGVTLSDIIDPNTTLVPSSFAVAGSDNFNTIGNVKITVPVAQGLLANDTDPETGNNTGMTASPATTSSTQCAACNNVTISSDGSFTYDPPVGFTGTDTFTYTATTSGGKSVQSQAKITVAGRIWFVNNNAGACSSNCDGRLSHPFQTLANFQALNDNAAALTHAKAGDTVFLYESGTAYVAPVVMLSTQKLVGQDASVTLIAITGLTQPSGTDPLPVMNATPATATTITTTAAATNAVNVSAGSTLLRGFTVGNTTGAKIFGNNFGTLTVGNSTTPDVTLNGNGQALNLTTGTFAATSGFAGVTTTSSTTSGLTLTGVAGTVAFGSTNVSGQTAECLVTTSSTADINFGNTSCTGGANGVTFSGNTAGTRTFGTLSVSGGSGNAFVHSGGGGNVTVNGAATLSSGAPDTVVIQNAASGNVINFAGGATVNKTGAGGEAVQWSGTNTGATLTFATLAVTTSNAAGLNLSGGGTVNVTTAAGSSVSATGVGATVAPAITASSVTLGANFTTLSSTNSGGSGTGLSLASVSGSLTVNNGAGTATNIQNSGGSGISMSASGATVNLGNTVVNGSGAAGVVFTGSSGGLTFSDLDVSPDTGVQALNVTTSAGTFTATSGTISTTNANAVTAVSTPLNVTLDSVSANISAATAASGVVLTGATGTFNVNGGTVTGGNATAFAVTGGTVSATYKGGVSQANAQPLVSVSGGHNTGTLTFDTGALSATGGTGLQFDNADGTYNFNGTTTLAGGDAGVDILNGSGGTFFFGTNASITNPASASAAPAGVGFYISGSNAAGIYNGSISDNTGFAIDIDNHDAGTFTFATGSITSTAQGVRVANSNGGTINFDSPTKNLNTGASQAVTL